MNPGGLEKSKEIIAESARGSKEALVKVVGKAKETLLGGNERFKDSLKKAGADYGSAAASAITAVPKALWKIRQPKEAVNSVYKDFSKVVHGAFAPARIAAGAARSGADKAIQSLKKLPKLPFAVAGVLGGALTATARAADKLDKAIFDTPKPKPSKAQPEMPVSPVPGEPGKKPSASEALFPGINESKTEESASSTVQPGADSSPVTVQADNGIDISGSQSPKNPEPSV